MDAKGSHSTSWTSVWRRPKPVPLPIPSSLDDAKTCPEASTSHLAWFFATWLKPLIDIASQRPLEATDLWRHPDKGSAALVADRLEHIYFAKREADADWNAKLDSGVYRPSALRRQWWRARALVGLGTADGQRKAALLESMCVRSLTLPIR